VETKTTNFILFSSQTRARGRPVPAVREYPAVFHSARGAGIITFYKLRTVTTAGPIICDERKIYRFTTGLYYYVYNNIIYKRISLLSRRGRGESYDIALKKNHYY